MMRERVLNRMIDDDAPIGPADVDEAARFLRLWSWLKAVAAVGAGLGGALSVGVVGQWQAGQQAKTACEARVVAVHAGLEQALPEGAVLHRGLGAVVVDTPELVALMVDGRVVNSTLRCRAGDRVPARAWVSSP